jgi:hypothetical protein
MPRMKRRGHKTREVEIPLSELSDEQLEAEQKKALQDHKAGGSAWDYLKRSGDIIAEDRDRRARRLHAQA